MLADPRSSPVEPSHVAVQSPAVFSIVFSFSNVDHNPVGNVHVRDLNPFDWSNPSRMEFSIGLASMDRS